MALAKVTEEDPFNGLPETAEFGSLATQSGGGDLHLYYDDVYSLAGPERIEWARRCEAAALAADPRITNSDGGSFDAATGRKVLANSRGFLGELSHQLRRRLRSAPRHGRRRQNAARRLVVQRPQLRRSSNPLKPSGKKPPAAPSAAWAPAASPPSACPSSSRLKSRVP